MNKKIRQFSIGNLVILIMILLAGQGISFLASPNSWRGFVQVLPKIISMIFFWGPIMAVISYLFIAAALRILGFKSWEDLRRESIEENNPAPAIIFSGMLIASVLFLLVVIRP
ncbi:MAG: hypothetical protein FJZ87_05040 [Chloroflexi bacterium]|nr:hypothetical protein [Chloroflexota bacterium]